MVSFPRNQQPVGELHRVAFAPPSPPKQNNNDCLQLLGATLASPRRRSTGSCHRGAGGERTGRAAAAAAAAGLVGALQRLGRLRLAPLHAEEGHSRYLRSPVSMRMINKAREEQNTVLARDPSGLALCNGIALICPRGLDQSDPSGTTTCNSPSAYLQT